MKILKISVLDTYFLLLKSYRQTWFSLSMVCFSLLIATAGLCAVLIINQGAKESYSGQASLQLLPAEYQILPNDGADGIAISDYAAIKQLGISKAVAIAESAQHLYVDGQRISQGRVTLVGLDFLALLNQSTVVDENQALNSAGLANGLNQAGALSFSSPVTLIHPNFIQELRINTDTKLNLKQDLSNTLPPLFSLAVEGMSDALIVDIGVLFGIDKRLMISRILLLKGTSTAQIDLITQHLPEHLTLEIISLEKDSPQMTQSFYLNLFAMALLMFAVCLFIVMNAFNLLIFKRFAMLKIFRQLGIGRQQILCAHAIEFIIFALLISLLGLWFGSQLAIFASPAIRNIVEGLYRVQVGFSDTSWLTLYAKVVLISIAGIALALLSPFRQLNRSLSTTHSDSNNEQLNGVLSVLSGALALVAVLIFIYSTHLGVLLMGAACVILSGCCALMVMFPQCLKLLYRCIPKQLTLTRLSVAQASFLSTKTKIACCAFFIAATSNLGMNLMVDSFRGSTESWLSQRLVADHYLYSDDPELNAQLRDIAIKSGVTIYPRYEQDIDLDEKRVQLFSYPIEDEFKRAMVFESATANVWQGFESSQSVFINQQLAIRSGLSLNDNVRFTHPISQQAQNFYIGGIIYDYGNPYGQVLLNVSEFSQNMRDASIFAISGNPLQVDEFKEALQSIGMNTDNQLYKTKEILSGSMAVFDRTFIITDSLNLVTLLVASLSLACTIVILLEQSRPQTMLLRAMGISAWQSRRILMQQYIFLCAVALLAATPFGILLSYVLIEQINYHAFNWSYPLIIDWQNIFQLYALSLLIVVLVISLPILYTTKQSLAQELKWLD